MAATAARARATAGRGASTRLLPLARHPRWTTLASLRVALALTAAAATLAATAEAAPEPRAMRGSPPAVSGARHLQLQLDCDVGTVPACPGEHMYDPSVQRGLTRRSDGTLYCLSTTWLVEPYSCVSCGDGLFRSPEMVAQFRAGELGSLAVCGACQTCDDAAAGELGVTANCTNEADAVCECDSALVLGPAVSGSGSLLCMTEAQKAENEAILRGDTVLAQIDNLTWVAAVLTLVCLPCVGWCCVAACKLALQARKERAREALMAPGFTPGHHPLAKAASFRKQTELVQAFPPPPESDAPPEKRALIKAASVRKLKLKAAAATASVSPDHRSSEGPAAVTARASGSSASLSIGSGGGSAVNQGGGGLARKLSKFSLLGSRRPASLGHVTATIDSDVTPPKPQLGTNGSFAASAAALPDDEDLMVGPPVLWMGSASAGSKRNLFADVTVSGAGAPAGPGAGGAARKTRVPAVGVLELQVKRVRGCSKGTDIVATVVIDGASYATPAYKGKGLRDAAWTSVLFKIPTARNKLADAGQTPYAPEAVVRVTSSGTGKELGSGTLPTWEFAGGVPQDLWVKLDRDEYNVGAVGKGEVHVVGVYRAMDEASSTPGRTSAGDGQRGSSGTRTGKAAAAKGGARAGRGNSAAAGGATVAKTANAGSPNT